MVEVETGEPPDVVEPARDVGHRVGLALVHRVHLVAEGEEGEDLGVGGGVGGD